MTGRPRFTQAARRMRGVSRRMGVVGILVASILVAFVPSSARADFANGGFESGSLSGWTTEFATVSLNFFNQRSFSSWTTSQPAGFPTPRVIDGTQATLPVVGQIVPYCDQFMGQINDEQGGQHATRIRQKITLGSTELNCSEIKVHWGALLGVGDGHTDQQQAYFEIVVKVNGNQVEQFKANANDATSANGWTCIGGANGNFCYKSGVFLYNLRDVSNGDDVEIIMTAADCTESGHGATAFLDCATIDAPCGRSCSPGNTSTIPTPTIPNVFTPNGDGINDLARITHIQQACSLKYQIFDRFGLEMFSDQVFEPLGFSDGTYAGWNGKVQSTGDDATEGTYFYVITAKNCNDTQVWTGDLALFR